MTQRTLDVTCGRPAWRGASSGGPSVIADVIFAVVIFAVVIGASPVGRGRRSQSLGYVGGGCGRGETCGTRGKLAMLTRGESERPRKRRQSGVVDLDGNLGPELH
jgi:hypothetical protein